ncbi:M23 family metallopeptidase [Helicobacter trogontum]|uniref:M23 family metallopeptidase n=1 Tax=Helicobacter trogontum TaxID=50960 RepID=A0A4U8TLM1_9HELI|nr:M23 family metallopeptidase [Helicobacter trogontum]MDY5184468.1 M23 family metallopeptidase [Helicobacter trogontum]TLD99707.1 M23 family metallopeptidase [Helicobacter trogontum]
MIRLILAGMSCIFFISMFLLLHTAGFERIPPNIELYVSKESDKVLHHIYTSFFNPENTIYLSAYDASGLASYHVSITDKNGKVLVEDSEVLLKKTEELNIALPKIPNLADGEEVFYHVSVRDWSNSNFFRGNETTITKHFIINKSTPQVQVIAASEQIMYGGSALIAFSIQQLGLYDKVKDSGIDKVIVSNGHDEFEAYPFINKQGKVIYLSLIAWPIKNTFFDGTIQVIDSAMNEKKIQVPIATNVNYLRRKFNMIISNSRLQTIMKRLEHSVVMPQDLATDVEKFQFFNETIKHQHNQKIASFFHISTQMYTESSIPRLNVFAPVKDAQMSGRFGDEYIYKYHKEHIGASVRYGIEFIGEHNKEIINSNNAVVAFKGNIGSYGNLVVLNHILGLSSIYGYLDTIPTLPNHIQSLMQIGQMGASGFATTNSLFFAVLVQGHFVNPNEWLQPEWINTNINQVLDRADNFGVKR